MRENMGLYRGKRTKDGVWIEGPLLFVEDKPAIYDQTDTDISAVWEYGEARLWGCCEVDPETVGQFTGVTDKNGKKVFEHDIVRFDRGTFVVVFLDFRMSFCFDGLHGRGCVPGFTMAHWEHLEVIGNIHDNPELLEVSK